MDRQGKFHIKSKGDFGNKPWLINGEWVKTGFVVTLNGANIMPAATWFRTIREALAAIYILQADRTHFWDKVRAPEFKQWTRQ